MNSWQNPFARNDQNSAHHQQEHSKYPQDFSDDDESGDQVVYNHSHLESLLGLYQQGKQERVQEVTQIVTSSKTTKGQRHSSSDSYLSSEKEKRAWASLEKLHSFSFGGTQIQFQKAHNENYLPQTPSENSLSLHKSNRQFQLSFDPEAPQLGTVQCSDSEDDKQVEEQETCPWSKIIKEAEELDENRQENVIKCSSLTGHSGTTRSQKGVSAKQRLKFSIRPVKPSFYGKGASKQLNNNGVKVSLAQQFQKLTGPEISGHNSRKLPMVERLQGLFEKNSSSPCPSYKSRGIKRKETRAVTVGKRTLSSSSGRCMIANEDIPNSLDSDEASGDDTNNGLGPMPIFPMGKAQSLTDRFQEALSAAPENGSNASFFNRPSGPVFGFSDRLQRVLQHEKHQHMQFMKILHMGEKLQDVNKCMDVRILAKNFEAKLTVCKCTVEKALQNTESIQNKTSNVENEGCHSITVIFSSRTSGNLEIEVGKVVRIHPPWKELQLTEYEKIIVCTYFCEMAPLYR